ncbi:MAG: fatty acid--CoA ligase family protein [Deltaproteobacteria bacterium]|nr:fatty acid--CoA ligase family protein [Deltaproteobacteria bacterium]
MSSSSFRPSSLGTIPRLVQDSAQRYASRNAVEDDGRNLSFAELGQAAVASTRAFVAAGVAPGDRVAIWAHNCLEWVLAAVGLQGAGAVLVPMNTRFKGREAAYILNKSRARLLFTVGEFLGTRYVDMLDEQTLPHLERTITLQFHDSRAIPWDDFIASGSSIDETAARARIESVAPDELSDILFTSGTTGKPKGVMCTHEQVMRGFESWTELVGLREGDRYLIVNPFFHAFGYKAGWLACIMRGATMLPHAVFDADAVLARVAEDQISVLPGPPALHQSMLMHPERANFDLSNLRLSVTGAAAIPVELIRRMKSDLGFDTVITGYGLTEASGIATMCRDGDDAETIATTSGRAIDDVEVSCIDSEGREVPRGEPGEVVVRGYNVMQGYFEDEEQTRDTIDAEGWLHTGDIGVMDERGYLQITDRVKDMFIMGGFNCYPAEIEGQLFEHPEVSLVAVIGIPDERMGEVGMAFIVAEPGTTPNAETITTWCKDNMANYKVPRRIEVVDELPMNAAGKVQKYLLREKALAGH